MLQIHLAAAAGNGRRTVAPPPPLEARLDRTVLTVRPGRNRLPPGWMTARVLTVRVDGRHLLGSPLDLSRLRRIEGVVEGRAEGLTGWVWHPADPEADPALRIEPLNGGKARRLVLRQPATALPPDEAGPFARPRRLHVPLADCPAGPLRVLGPDGTELPGSPVDAHAPIVEATLAADAVARRFPARRRRDGQPPGPPMPRDPPAAGRVCDVALAVLHLLPADLDACLDAALAGARAPGRVVIVDAVSQSEGARRALRARVGTRAKVLACPAPAGWAAAASAALLATDADTVLLDSALRVGPGWLTGLIAAANAAPAAGSVSGLIAGAPAEAPFAIGGGAAALPAARRGDAPIAMPTMGRSLVLLRRACIRATGLPRADAFAQGPLAEADFAARAQALGWAHLAAPSVIAWRSLAVPEGPVHAALARRNAAVLARLHPDLPDRLVARGTADPLRLARRAIDLRRWAGGRRRCDAVALVTHDDGGGVERVVASRIAEIRREGLRPIVLRPLPEDGPAGVRLCDGLSRDFPDLRFHLPREADELLEVLRASRVARVEIHSLLHHAQALRDLPSRLGVPHELYVHDYAAFCPRVLLTGPAHRYCGEPDLAACEACIADAGRIVDEPASLAEYRAVNAALLARARSVIAPARDVAERLRRQFPAVQPVVRAWEAALPARARRRLPAGEARRVCVIGAIGIEKGYEVLLACARDAAARNLHLSFIVVGHTIDDGRLLETGRAFVTGRFEPGEEIALIRTQQAHFSFLPSVCPETWSFAMSAAWRAGLDVAAFDLGAPAERIRQSGNGWLLPLGLAPEAVNNALLALA